MANVLSKACNRCGQEKPLDAFGYHATGLHKRRPYCRACNVVVAQEYRRRHPRGELKTRLRKKYRMSLEAYDEMLEAQENACAICYRAFGDSQATTPCVDHDHKGGRVRGILCFNCNTVLGKVRDDPAVLRSAIAYLNRGGQ